MPCKIGMHVQALIGKNVARLRKRQDLSQEELALRVEVVAQTYISNLEAGRCNPTAVTLYLIAKALDAKVADLFDERDIGPELLNGPVVIKSKRSGKKSI